MGGSLFRFMGGLARNMIVANTFGSFSLLIMVVLGGFILARGTNSISYNFFSIGRAPAACMFTNKFLLLLLRRECQEMVDLGLLDLPSNVCAKCYIRK
jgi:hypothetical protein